MAVAEYLADKSAYGRLHRRAVYQSLGPLIERGLVATCTLIDMEILFSTRTATDYDAVLTERGGLERLDLDQLDWDRALAVQQALAQRGMTRAVGIPDLLVAAVAERHRVTVLHYDEDFDRISKVTGQDTQWVVPRGTVP